jgi:beta-1,3-N-acetylgalactosaminyltransferase 2
MPFCTGNLYVMSGDIVEWLAKCPAPLRYYEGEDISVGQWLSPLGLTLVDDTRVIAYAPNTPTWEEHGCPKDMISQHYVDPPTMLRWYMNEVAGKLPCA